MDVSKTKFLIIADSRGRNIRGPLDKQEFRTKICSYPGTGISMSVTRSLRIIREWNPHVITLCGSICDITKMDVLNRRVSVRYDSINESTNHYMSQVKEALEMLHILHPDTKVQLTTVIGLDITNTNNLNFKNLKGTDLETYNATKTPNPDQERLNNTILNINREIFALNTINGIPTAWTSNCVHAYKHGRTYHRYNKLFDGCHLAAKTNEEWVHFLSQSFRKMSKFEFKY